MITAIGNPVYDEIRTPKVDTQGRVLSGCSTNAALVLARLGAPVRLVGSVGRDFEEKFARDMSRNGIEAHPLPSYETGGFKLHYYDDYGNRTLDLLGQAASIDHLRPELYTDADAVLIGPILGETSFDLIRKIRSGFSGVMMLDPQGLLRTFSTDKRIEHVKPTGIEPVIGLFDIVKPNELEGQILTGVDCRKDPYEAARIIKTWGPQIVIVTLAELGAVVFDGETMLDVPPYPANLLDATGAGDTFMAGFIFEWLRTKDLKEAATFATASSSVMIENCGPNFEMTEAMLRERQAELTERIDTFRVQVAVNA